MSDTRRVCVVRWTEGSEPSEAADELAAEEPLEIRIGGQPVSITMRTPGHDAELVAGFLLSEGFLDAGTLPLIRHEGTNVVNIAISGFKGREFAAIRRHSVTSTSCGLCGKGSIEAVHQHFPPVDSNLRISRQCFPRMLAALSAAQAAFGKTGGLHAAGIFDAEGNLMIAHEDVGRHNAVDKVIGHALLRRLLPLEQHVLIVSSRASFEIAQKALGARIPVLAAVSAPSSLAVEFALASGQTLIGFLRPGRYNLYTHGERVTA